VTDGTSIWVVDGSALKVFKYTLSGSALGSWSIDPADTHPTGITIDPTDVSNIWIVDNGTDEVYQYTAAATRTSGSQKAAATFALAAGDTNPQGIADPPPPDMLITSTASAPAVTQASVPAVNAAATSPTPIAAALPSMAGRDAVFAMLAPESFQGPDTPSADLMAVGQASTYQPPLTPGTSQGLGSEGGVAGLLGGTWTGEENPASAPATDCLFTMMLEDVGGAAE